MISGRYAPIVCALLGLALVPTFIHSYAGSSVVDGRKAAAIPTELAGYTSLPAGIRKGDWGQRRFDSFDWIERTYRAPGDEVILTVVRTYDPKSVYHHPELAVTTAHFVDDEVLSLDGAPDVPMHVLRGETAEAPLAAYVLHYDDRFVADPIWFQLRTAGELLFSGRKPMTLLFMVDARPSNSDVAALPATRLLLEAARQFAAALTPAAEGP